MIMVMCALNYADRSSLSASMPLISQEFHLSPSSVGWLLSASLWIYILLNFPSAVLAEKYGNRIMGSLSVAFWSLAMVAGALGGSYGNLLVSRVLLGVGEAPTFPIGASVINRLSSSGERPVLFTVFMASMQVGLALGTAVAGALTYVYGWRLATVILALPGFVWALVWWVRYRDHRVAVHVGTADEAAPPRPSVLQLLAILRKRSFAGIVISGASGNYMNFLMVSWLPIYMNHKFGLNMAIAGFDASLTYLAAAAISVILSMAITYLSRGYGSTTASNRVVTSVLFVISAFLVMIIPQANSAMAVVVGVGLALGFVRAGSGANQALLNDLLVPSRYIGSAFGLALTFTNSVGMVAPIVTGYIVERTGTFYAAFCVASGLLLVGAASSFFYTRTPIEILESGGTT
ncbi:MFS transporter [Novacetimonas hansenii]|uniref:MFS transporter n=1 Tax=Novacetimonas hansenii TaxID=436 RepID=UPI0015B990F6|nr:MFS transporter [Novacetimonas hansenii]